MINFSPDTFTGRVGVITVVAMIITVLAYPLGFFFRPFALITVAALFVASIAGLIYLVAWVSDAEDSQERHRRYH